MSDWRIARETVASIAGGATLNVDVDADSNGGSPPISSLIRRIVVAPVAATVFAFRIFSREGRIPDPGHADYSLVAEFTWSVDDVDSIEPLQISNAIPYFDEDAAAGTNYEGKFWCQLEIKAAAPASAFHIMLAFDD